MKKNSVTSVTSVTLQIEQKLDAMNKGQRCRVNKAHEHWELMSKILEQRNDFKIEHRWIVKVDGYDPLFWESGGRGGYQEYLKYKMK